jgi:hypothetical protein
VEPAERQELTEAFDHAIPAGNWILTQDPHGFVTVDHYPKPAAARHAFDHLPDLEGPGEEDGTITPAGPLGSRYAVALAGSFLGYANGMDQATAMLREAMDTDRYWPDAWFIGDQGQPPPPQPLAAMTRRWAAAGPGTGMAVVPLVGHWRDGSQRRAQAAWSEAAVAPPVWSSGDGCFVRPAHLRSPRPLQTRRVPPTNTTHRRWAPTRRRSLDEGR